VYQLGWRLGRKGASGRGEFDRIEEHGLHIWIGFYENAFRLIRQVYEELGRPAGTPLATWDAAFKKHSLWVIDEHIDGQWKHWPFTFPTDDATPGTGGVLPSPHEYLELAMNLLRELFHRSPHATAAAGPQDAPGDATLERQEPSMNHGHGLLDHAHQLATKLREYTSHAPKQEYEEIASRLHGFSAWLRERRSVGSGEHDEWRRLHILVELVASTARGLIHDVLLTGNHDLGALDGEDFRDWLKRHGAPEEAYNSAAVQGFLYDLAFAYRNGDTSQPSFAAGTALRCALRVLFTYKGAIFWKMQAGMGDTIFAPIYEVLRARGVDFKFFHAVRNVGLSADQSSVATIEIGRQATVTSGEYQPLRDVSGLPCWPSEPDYGQLAEGEELRAGGIDLESFWTPWQDRERIVLEAGQDFDVAILGVPLGSLPFICPELVEASPRWQDMVEKVETARTQAFQLWMRPSLEELGWSLGSPVLDAYVSPLNTWADMSQLVPRESWPQEQTPGSIAYFCGPMQGGIPDPGDGDAPHRERARVQEAARDLVARNIAPLWPRAVDGSPEQSFNWDLLLGPDGAAGEARFDAQFFRANIDPSERYVLAVVDSSTYRLGADESGFANLILAGDWTKNGINAGRIEAAVMSGLLAACAVCGYPSRDQIIGLDHL
ncbi:MAG: hypothetical protein M3121_00055, partial [Chloroflexota bacterium]|nr:hypothetical protein [Chloroflexota bacterium]